MSAEWFVSAAELGHSTSPEPEWILDGYLAEGWLAMLAGKPKAGKSDWTCAFIEAVAGGAATFLGRAVNGGPVVYVSEEGAGTLAHKLRPLANVRVMTRDAIWPRPGWLELISGAVEEAVRVGAVLLVIDSLAFWAGFREGQQKDSSAVLVKMARLSEATHAGLAVLLVHHQRKAGGEEGDAVRDSNAFLGSVDVLIELERPDDANAPDNQRLLVAIGRWPATTPVLQVERHPDDGAWYDVGEARSRTDVKHRSSLARLLGELPDEWATEPEIAEGATGSKEVLGSLLRELYRDGLIVRTGAGKRGAPYLYKKAPLSPSGAGTGDGGESTTSTAPVSPPPPYRRGRKGVGSERTRESTNGHPVLVYGDLTKFDWRRRS
jgi:hypothetical protein